MSQPCTANKATKRIEGLLVRRCIAALAKSHGDWLRMRDTDALCRFTISAALACSDLNDVW
jgi:hypothetical protein